MERSEKIGFGIATVAHVLLFGVLSTGFLAAPNPLKLNSPPIDVTMVDEVSLKSAAPKISTQPPPPSQAPEAGRPEEAAPSEPEPAPPSPAPRPTPAPRPLPQQAPPAPPPPRPAPAPREVEKPRPAPPRKAETKPVPEKAKPVPAKVAEKPAAKAPAPTKGAGKAERSHGSLLGPDFLKGIQAEKPAKPAANTPPAATLGPREQAALDAEIRRQVKPYWKAPTGADAEQLRTIVSVNLASTGQLVGDPQVVQTTGITASNRAQVKLHQELAIKAIRLAAPFRLPPALYDNWKSLEISFDKRLSQ